MNNWLFLSLLLAHVIGDFYLQNDKYCAQKEEVQKLVPVCAFAYYRRGIMGSCSYL